jgi:hypothetical protein
MPVQMDDMGGSDICDLINLHPGTGEQQKEGLNKKNEMKRVEKGAS